MISSIYFILTATFSEIVFINWWTFCHTELWTLWRVGIRPISASDSWAPSLRLTAMTSCCCCWQRCYSNSEWRCQRKLFSFCTILSFSTPIRRTHSTPPSDDESQYTPWVKKGDTTQTLVLFHQLVTGLRNPSHR